MSIERQNGTGATNDGERASRARHAESDFVQHLHVEGTEAGPEKMLEEYRLLQEQCEKAEADFTKISNEAAALRADDKRKALLTLVGRQFKLDMEAAAKKRDELGERILEMGGTLNPVQ